MIELADRGRQLVERGELSPPGMIDNLSLCEYWRQQRELVSIRGECAARCECDQVEHTKGHAVCPHTYEPCKRLKLVEIIKLWERVNA